MINIPNARNCNRTTTAIDCMKYRGSAIKAVLKGKKSGTFVSDCHFQIKMIKIFRTFWTKFPLQDLYVCVFPVCLAHTGSHGVLIFLIQLQMQYWPEYNLLVIFLSKALPHSVNVLQCEGLIYLHHIDLLTIT